MLAILSSCKGIQHVLSCPPSRSGIRGRPTHFLVRMSVPQEALRAYVLADTGAQNQAESTVRLVVTHSNLQASFMDIRLDLHVRGRLPTTGHAWAASGGLDIKGGASCQAGVSMLAEEECKCVAVAPPFPSLLTPHQPFR